MKHKPFNKNQTTVEKETTVEILIRASLTDDGTLPRKGDVSNSPDVIPYGTQEAENPNVFFIKNYEENVNANLMASKQNYIYMRGQDLIAELQQGDMYVYYALNSELDTPRKWEKNILKTAAGRNYNTVTGQSEGSILVGLYPYLWTPPETYEGNLYSLIGVVVPSGTIPDFSGIDNFEEYVEHNKTIGWTKVTIDPTPPPPTPTQRWKTTFAYDQGEEEKEMFFNMNCKNIPSGTFISFSSDNTTGPNPVIKLDKTKVTDSNGTYGIQSNVPAGYKGNISFNFFCEDTPPEESSITFQAYYLESTGSGPQKPVIIASVTTAN